jgi:transcriptional regulator with XRE-family HTH domain
MTIPKTPASDVDKQLGLHVRTARHALKLSVEALAKSSGLSVGEIEDIEAGAKRASALEIYRLSKCLELELAAFFDTLAPPEAPSQARQSLRQKCVIDLMKVEDPADLEAVAAFIGDLLMRQKPQ